MDYVRFRCQVNHRSNYLFLVKYLSHTAPSYTGLFLMQDKLLAITI